MILHNNLTVSSIAHNPELLVVIQNFIQENQFDVDFSKLIKLATGIADFDIVKPNLAHLNGVEGFKLTLDEYMPSRQYSEPEFDRLLSIEKVADYYHFPPFGIYAIFVLEALLEAIKTDNHDYKTQCLEVCRISLRQAQHQEHYQEALEQMHEKEAIQIRKKMNQNASNEREKRRKHAIEDYIAEAAVFAWWQLKSPNIANITEFIFSIASVDHREILKPYFANQDTDYNSNRFRDDGEIVINDKSVAGICQKVLKYIKKNKSHVNITTLGLVKGNKSAHKDDLITAWFDRHKLPQYLVIIDIADSAINSWGLCTLLDEYFDGFDNKIQIQNTTYLTPYSKS